MKNYINNYIEIYQELKDIIKSNNTINTKSISDVYKNEFYMFLTICKINNFELNYPFHEFEKIIEFVLSQSDLKSKIENFLNIPLIFNKLYDELLQKTFIEQFKIHFNHDIVSTKINNKCSISFRSCNKVILTEILSNLLFVDDIIKLLSNKFNFIPTNLSLYKDKKELKVGFQLIEYNIDDNIDENIDDNYIDIVIKFKSNLNQI